MKTNKSYTKRIKVNEKRQSSLLVSLAKNHFNARQTGQQRTSSQANTAVEFE